MTLIASPAWEAVARGMCHQFLSCEDRSLLPLFAGESPLSSVLQPDFQKTFLFLARKDLVLEQGFSTLSAEVTWIRSRPDVAGRGWTYGQSSPENSQEAAQMKISPGPRPEDLNQPSEIQGANIRDFLFQKFASSTEDARRRPVPCWPIRINSQKSKVDCSEPFRGIANLNTSANLSAVLIHAGSGSPEKNWPLESYEKLADLCIQYGLSVFWTLGPADGFIKQALIQKGVLPAPWPIQDHNQAAQHFLECSLFELITVMRRIPMIMGNDSGIIHLGAAMGLDVLSIFGRSDPNLWAPDGRSANIYCAGSQDCFPSEKEVLEILDKQLKAVRSRPIS